MAPIDRKCGTEQSGDVVRPVSDCDSLEVISCPEQSSYGRLFALEGHEPLIIGRAEGCDVLIDDNAVSRAHCRMQRLGNHWHIRDEGSKTGTFVNGEKLTGLDLVCPGDLITIGRTTLHFVRAGDPASDMTDVIKRAYRQEKSLARVPYPVAIQFPVVEASATWEERVARLVSGIEISLRLLVSIQLGWILQFSSDELRRNAASELAEVKGDRQPISFGSWVRVAHNLSGQLVGAVPPEWEAATCMQQRGQGLPRSELLTKLREAVALRNEFAHRTGGRSSNAWEKEAVKLSGTMSALRALFEGESALSMVSAATAQIHGDGEYEYELRRHSGAVEFFSIERQVLRRPLLSEWCYMLSEDGARIVPLSPFFFTSVCETCGRLEVYSSSMFVSEPGKIVSGVGVATGHPGQAKYRGASPSSQAGPPPPRPHAHCETLPGDTLEVAVED